MSTAYQDQNRSSKVNWRLKRVHNAKMSEEKDNLKSIKVYKFNNTKENWHEFALKFRVIADTRGYWGIINGTMIPPDEQITITVTTEDRCEVLKEQRRN